MEKKQVNTTERKAATVIPAESSDDELLSQLMESHGGVKEHTELVNENARIRREVLNTLRARGYEKPDLAARLEVTPQRIGQLIKTGPPPERALLARGSATISLGSEHVDPTSHEAGRPELQAVDVVAAACKSYGLDVSTEAVPAPGIVDLNRDNLIVIGSPRALPIISQVLGSDPHLGFASDTEGWHLVDRNTARTYRSPTDRGTPSDVAYLGRLPRPDGRGSFLYLAGINDIGTLGAAKHLSNHVAGLYAQVRTRRWSTLVAVSYDPKTRAVTHTECLTEVYAQ